MVLMSLGRLPCTSAEPPICRAHPKDRSASASHSGLSVSERYFDLVECSKTPHELLSNMVSMRDKASLLQRQLKAKEPTWTVCGNVQHATGKCLDYELQCVPAAPSESVSRIRIRSLICSLLTRNRMSNRLLRLRYSWMVNQVRMANVNLSSARPSSSSCPFSLEEELFQRRAPRSVLIERDPRAGYDPRFCGLYCNCPKGRVNVRKGSSAPLMTSYTKRSDTQLASPGRDLL